MNPTSPTELSTAAPGAATIEEATFRTGKVSAVATAHGVHDTYQAFLPPLLPLLIEKFSLIKTEAGLLSVFMTAPSLLQPFIGYLADRRSLRIFVILTPTITALAMSLLGIAPYYWLAAMLLIIAGLSSASLHATGPVLAGRLSANRLGMGMSFWMVGGELGRTLGPIIIVSAVSTLGMQRTPWLAVGGVLVSLWMAVQLRQLPARHPESHNALPWKKALITMRPVLIPLSIILITRALAFVSVSTYLPTFLTEEGANLMLAGASLSVLEAAGVIGALLSGSLSDRIGRRPVMIFSLVSTSLFIFLLLNLHGWLQFPALLGLGFGLLSMTPVVMAIVQESFPENRALANGIYMAVSFVSSSFATLTVGAIGDMFSLRTAYWLSGVLVLAGLPFLFRLPASQKTLKS
ncbi:sugar phosphate permease [Bellilinea caldifistulae]|uniref:MFS transporter n=1 Tax=Bellilinea caldifistulae TaxID=360411 RepID=UPI0007824E25|nr:MFS transporter [Bellilinea caldifistulae]GAP09876.1 sugar phosphate permease [Bellilinea caldifistulae]